MPQEEVVKLFNSKSLREAIKQRDFRFTGLQLVRLIYEHAKSYDQRLALLGEIAVGSSSLEACALARDCIRYQEESLEAFMQPKDNTVYELHIKDHAEAYDERYLIQDFNSALKVFKAFHKHYESTAEDTGYFAIMRRQYVDQNTAADFQEDEIGHCKLTKDAEILKVDVWKRQEQNNNDSLENRLFAIDVRFPNFIPPFSPVAYALPRGRTGYGIYVHHRNDGDVQNEDIHLDDSGFVIPLDCVYVKYGIYDQMELAHMHFCPMELEPIKREALPEPLRERYDGAAAYLCALEERLFKKSKP